MATLDRKTTFALFFGTRGFFPASLMDSARTELPRILKSLGYGFLMMDRAATPHGAVETTEQGRQYAAWLADNKGRYDGVILCLPNFGDECGAISALQDAGVPILIHAYPDELDKMAPESRRDAFCGKISIMDVFSQYGVRFTALAPHTVEPDSARFRAHLEHFDRLCRVVNGMKGTVVGAIGARTTPFKTVRIDELALQKAGITVETLDLASVIDRVRKMKPEGRVYDAKTRILLGAASWEGVPKEARENIVKLGVVLDAIIAEYGMHALTVRCWIELQQQLGISPCVLLGDLNDRGIAAACEVDVGNAVTMHALRLASGAPPACLDWNNNYGTDDNKCILFHCGPVPFALMKDKGQIVDHAILANAVGKGQGFGCNSGRIKPMPFTFGSMVTRDGHLKFYLGEGEFTDDPIPRDFFGCAGVARIKGLQHVLLHVGENGHRHHVSITPGHLMAPVSEALTRYLGWDVAIPQRNSPPAPEPVLIAPPSLPEDNKRPRKRKI